MSWDEVGIVMLSIGEVAQRAGVSRRQLRYWEQQNLLLPATIDCATGYRWYDENQLGRVRAIAELRDLGFSFAEVNALLDPALARVDLDAFLRHQVENLHDQISQSTSRLSKIEARLLMMERQTQEITRKLTLGPLPSLSLWGYSASVRDESDISMAVSRMRNLLPPHEGDCVMLFDGTDAGRITVSVAIDARVRSDMRQITTECVCEGVSVRFEAPLTNVSDTWVLISDELEKSDKIAAGVYRQILTADHSVLLQAPIKSRATHE